jgi:hypothetical protein
MNLLRGFSLGFISVVLLGCGDSPDEDDPPIPVAPAPKEAANQQQGGQGEADAATTRVGPFERSFDGIRFSVPAGWKEAELSPRQQGFVDARFLIPARGVDVELTCSSVGGGIEANIDRWKTQFRGGPGDEPVIETITVDGVDATWADLRGTFHAGMAAAAEPRTDWRMLGVGIPLAPREFYLKLTGPRDAVAAVAEDFRTFVKSARITR